MNPEFQRQLYLEFSFSRLIGMPLFLSVIFAFTYLLNDQKLDEDMASTAIVLYVFIVLFWGARQTSESIFDELSNKTWDIQKTSAISPWSLAWGKLFGSTIYNWYGGFICLFFYTISTPEPQSVVLITWFYALAGGVFIHSLSLLISLFALRKKQTFNTTFSYLFVIFALFVLMPVMGSTYDSNSEAIVWYGKEINNSVFLSFSLTLACFWMLVGIYRLLAEELQIRTFPWVWLSFLIFLISYISGGVIGTDLGKDLGEKLFTEGLSVFLLVGFCVCIILTYLLLLLDNNNPMLARKLWVYAQQTQWERFLEELPCWFISLCFVLPCSLLLTLLVPHEKVGGLILYPFVVFLLILRDVAIVLYFSYAPNPKRALGLSLLYITFLYFIIPAIFFESGAKFIGALFLPLLSDNVFLAIIFASFHAGGSGFLLFQRWQKSFSS